MKEVFRTNDLVKLSFIEHLLQEAGVQYFIADQHISAVEGNIGAFPRRVMVADDLAAAAHLSVLDFLGDVDWGRHPEAKNWYAKMKSRPSFRELLDDQVLLV